MKERAVRLIESSRKVKPKVVKDKLADEVSNVPQSSDPNASAAKRYLDGELALHIHVPRNSIGRAQYLNPDGICAVFQSAGPDSHFDNHAIETAHVDSDIGGSTHWRGQSCRVDDAMFVAVPKRGEDAEFVTLRSAPSFVRLSRLNDCNMTRIDAFQSVRPVAVPCMSFLFLFSRFLQHTDGELIPVGWPVSGQANELPDQMVEAGTHVMNRLASDNAEAGRRVPDILVGEDLPFSPLVWLRGDFVGVAFDVIGKFVSEEIQLLLRPVELGPTTFQRGATHGA